MWYLISASIITTCERGAFATQPNQIMASKSTQPARRGGGGELVCWGRWRQIWAASKLQRSGDACAGHGHARSLYSGSSRRARECDSKSRFIEPHPRSISALPARPPPSLQTALSSARLDGGVSLFPSRLCKTPTDNGSDATKSHLVVF